MKKTFKTLVMMFALTFGVLLFAGTESKAATWQANLKQTEATTTRISFAWDSYLGSTPAEKYYIYFSTSGVDGTWGQLSGSEYERGNTCTVYGLSAGAVYYLKVVPVTIDGDVIIPLAESETIIVGTKPDVPKVTGLKQIGATRNSIAMSWGALAGASYYEVYRYNSYNN